MKNVALISDIHFGLKLPHAQVCPGGLSSDRLEDVSRAMLEFVQQAILANVEYVFILGDLFHSRSPSAPALDACARFLGLMSSAGMEVSILPGNHDAHDRSGGLYTIGSYNHLRIPNVSVFGVQPGDSSYAPIYCGNASFFPVPWVPERQLKKILASQDFKDALALGRSGKKCLLLHCQVVDSYDAGWKVEKGISKAEIEAAGLDAVYSGHVHTPQSFGMEIPGGYLGSPLIFAYGEVRPGLDGPIPERGWWLLDTDTMKAELQPLTSSPLFREWDFRRFPAAALLESVEDAVPELLAGIPAGRAAYLRVRLRGPRGVVSEAEAALNAATKMSKVEVRHVRVESVYTDDGTSERLKSAGATPGRALSPQELLGAFVRSTAPEPDRERLQAIGEELLG
jgi:hypothetical protein